jgi:hypothetical protein
MMVFTYHRSTPCIAGGLYMTGMGIVFILHVLEMAADMTIFLSKPLCRMSLPYLLEVIQ